MEISEILEYQIYPNLDAAQIFDDLDGLKREQNGYRANCPMCDDRDRKFYIYAGKPYGFCYHGKCQYKVNFWNYLQKKKGLTQHETLKELARLAGVRLPDTGGCSTREIEEKNKKSDQLEEFLKICKEELKRSKEAQGYLSDRGFSLEEAIGLDLGFYSSVNVIKVDFKGLRSREWEGRVVGLWRDRSGRGITVWGRDITGQSSKKYYYLFGESRYSPFCLERCYSKHIIAVEGILDVLSLQRCGFKEVVAFGGNRISGGQIESLLKTKIESVTLNFDHESSEAGLKGIEESIDKLERVGIRTYVIDPNFMPIANGKEKIDPDEFIRTQGAKAYQSLLDRAERGVEWKIERIVKRYGVKTTKGKDLVLSEGSKFLNAIPESRGVIFDHGLKRLASRLDMPLRTLEGALLNQKEKERREELKRFYTRFFGELQRYLSSDELDRIESSIEEHLFNLKAERIGERVDCFSLDRLLEEGKAYSEDGKLTGYQELDKTVKIMSKELIVLGARVRHGKSSFAYNLLLNFLEQDRYRDEMFVFFNLDVPSTIAMSRLSTIRARKDTGVVYSYKEDVLPCFQRQAFPKEIMAAFHFFWEMWGGETIFYGQ